MADYIPSSDAEFGDVGCWKWDVGSGKWNVGSWKGDVGSGSVSALLCGSNGRHDDRGNLVALAHQVGELCERDDAGFDKEFEPISGFVGFGLPSRSRSRIGRVHPSVLDDREFVNKTGSRLPPPRGSIVGPDGSGRAKKLPADDLCLSRRRERLSQLDNPERERLGAGLHRVFVHKGVS